MKKEDFVKLGLDEETAKKCESESEKELKDFVPYTRFKELIDEKNTLKSQVSERDIQLETLKKSTGDVDTMKRQIEDLQKDNMKKDDDYKAEIHKMKVDNAIGVALAGVNAINAKAVKPFLSDMDKAEFLEDGTIKGLSEQLDVLTKADDTKFLFSTQTKGKIKGAKTGETGKEDPDSKVDTSNMTYSELAAYMAENPDAKID